MLRDDSKEYSNIIDAEKEGEPVPVNRVKDRRGRQRYYPKYIRNTIQDFVNPESAKLHWISCYTYVLKTCKCNKKQGRTL